MPHFLVTFDRNDYSFSNKKQRLSVE